jgi:hypothetical protein
VRREQRAERVAVRVLVRRDEEPVVRADRLDDRREVSCVVVWFGGELIDESGHAHAVLDRVIVFEREQRSPLQPELARDPRLEDAVRRVEPGHALLRFFSAAEHADVDVAWRRSGEVSTPVTVTNPIRGILQLQQRLGEHLADAIR